MGVILGGGTTRFIRTDPSGLTQDLTIDLPLTNAEGLIETYREKIIEHEVMTLDLDNPDFQDLKRWFGVKVWWTFHYDTWVLGETLLKLDTLHTSSLRGYNLRIYPRFTDQPNRFFDNIVTDTKEYSVGIRKGGISAQYNRLPVYIFKTKGLIQDKQWRLTEFEAAGTPGVETFTSPLSIAPG